MNNRRITVVRPSQVFDSFMDDFFTSSPFTANSSSVTGIDINVKDEADKIIVTAKVPGFDQDEISISVEDNTLTLEATKKSEKEETEGDYQIKEFTQRNARRIVSLQSKVDGDRAEATMKNGILTISIPKSAEVMPKKINIKSE